MGSGNDVAGAVGTSAGLPARRRRVAAGAARRSGNGAGGRAGASSALPTKLDTIREAVGRLLRGQERVSLPAHGLDLVFDAGVVARCRACDLSWSVSRKQFGILGWWTCPRGGRAGGE